MTPEKRGNRAGHIAAFDFEVVRYANGDDAEADDGRRLDQHAGPRPAVRASVVVSPANEQSGEGAEGWPDEALEDRHGVLRVSHVWWSVCHPIPCRLAPSPRHEKTRSKAGCCRLLCREASSLAIPARCRWPRAPHDRSRPQRGP